MQQEPLSQPQPLPQKQKQDQTPFLVTPKHKKLHGFQFYESLNFPKFIIAPMVDQSELPYRMMCRKYGATLGYTPMLHSRLMQEKNGYKEKHFSTCPGDRPLITQFCGHDPEVMLKAAQMVEDETDAVDINCGCPQGIARKGLYGSFLLEKPEIIIAITRKLHEELKVPVTVKIRVLDDDEKTLKLCKDIEQAGASILTVHGRTKEQNKNKVTYCDWHIIKRIKDSLKIPVFANGGIYTFEDVQRCLEQTGVDGVMSAEALLENPALFSGQVKDLDILAEEYIDYWVKYDNQNFWYLKPHLFKIMHQGLKEHTDLRAELASLKGADIPGFRAVIQKLRKAREQNALEDKFGWYTRYKPQELTMEEFKSDVKIKVVHPNQAKEIEIAKIVENGGEPPKKKKKKRKRKGRDQLNTAKSNQDNDDNEDNDDGNEDNDDKQYENEVDRKQRELEEKIEKLDLDEDGRLREQGSEE